MIAIVDYGMGNLRSVGKALEAVGAKVKVTHDPQDVNAADAIVLPGVGAFHRAMENLARLDILPSIHKGIKAGKPFLGICLGLQLLFTKSEEHGIHKGLDVMAGRVKRFDTSLKVPHMGWNQVKKNSARPNVRGPQPFKGIPDGSYFYFAHTYYAEPEDEKIIIGKTKHGKLFTSAVNRDNIWGVQFHPEKSSKLGLKFLGNFLKLCRAG